jgi:putative N6-adenine-specific DNA methylase
MPRPEIVTALAVTARGLAPLAAGELRSQGITARDVDVEGASFRSPLVGVYAANLWLRTASRVLVRVAAFRAESFHELERRANRVPWSQYISATVPVRIRVTCRKSRLYHSDAVAERIAGAISRAGGTLAPLRASAIEAGEGVGDDAAGSGEGEQLIVVRMFHDECAISIDSSGALLHRRGYRQETAKAPLRETLAAAALMAAGWSAQGPLLDPMCGAGTIAIEGAWLARGRAPGLGRTFAFMGWPGFDRAIWDELVAAARSAERTTTPVIIQASDRDAGAVAVARRNAERAGVEADIAFSQRPLSAIEPPPGPGWLVTNPPYGVRVGATDRLRDLYAQLGHVARAKCLTWTVAILAADRGLARQTGLPFVRQLGTVNGGIPVEVLAAEVRTAAERPRSAVKRGASGGRRASREGRRR